MTNVRFGFIAFDRCFHCNRVKTYFWESTVPDPGDEYRDGACFWNRMEDAQSLMFDLRCTQCGRTESYRDLLGLLHCTSCLADCEIEIRRRELELRKIWVLVAFGFLPQAVEHPIPEHKLEILADYFNQRRDTSRSQIRILPFTLIKDLSLCRGDFIHDVGMLSPEPVTERRPLF